MMTFVDGQTFVSPFAPALNSPNLEYQLLGSDQADLCYAAPAAAALPDTESSPALIRNPAPGSSTTYPTAGSSTAYPTCTGPIREANGH